MLVMDQHAEGKYITVTSWLTRLKSSASRLFIQPFVEARILKYQSVTGLCDPPVTGGFPSERPITRKIFPFGDVIMI